MNDPVCELSFRTTSITISSDLTEINNIAPVLVSGEEIPVAVNFCQGYMCGVDVCLLVGGEEVWVGEVVLPVDELGEFSVPGVKGCPEVVGAGSPSCVVLGDS